MSSHIYPKSLCSFCICEQSEVNFPYPVYGLTCFILEAPEIIVSFKSFWWYKPESSEASGSPLLLRKERERDMATHSERRQRQGRCVQSQQS